ncbi:MAG: VanZ family protein [Gemmatimonadetes bacterium]|nr:VanZ family protein [Gemmatimonadota bacterium]
MLAKPDPDPAAAPRAGWRRLTAYVPAIVWAAGILFLGSRPDVRLPETRFPLDKLGHFLMFAGLGGLLAWGWRRLGGRPGWALLLGAALLVGGVDEWHQRTVAGRTSDVRDWAADAAGAVAGFTVVVRAARRGSGKERE